MLLCIFMNASCQKQQRRGSSAPVAGFMGSEIERDEQGRAADAAAKKVTGFAGMLQSARNSINRNMEPFSEGLHKVVGGSTDSGYESDSEASVTEVRLARSAAWVQGALVYSNISELRRDLRHTSVCHCSPQEQMVYPPALPATVSQFCDLSSRSFPICS